MYIRRLIFSCDLLSLYPPEHFLGMWFSGIMAIMNSNSDSTSPWKIPLWIIASAKLLPPAVNSTLQIFMVFSIKFMTSFDILLLLSLLLLSYRIFFFLFFLFFFFFWFLFFFFFWFFFWFFFFFFYYYYYYYYYYLNLWIRFILMQIFPGLHLLFSPCSSSILTIYQHVFIYSFFLSFFFSFFLY